MNNQIQAASRLPEDIFVSKTADLKLKEADANTKAEKVNSANTVAETKVALEKANAEQETKSATEGQEIEQEEIEQAIETVASFIENTIKNVSFTNDSSSGKTIIKVIDKETSELISQFPSDKIISMAERIKGLREEITGVSGILFEDSV